MACLGKCHYEVALTANNLALCHFKMAKYSSAIDGYYLCFSILKNLKLWNHPNNKNLYLNWFKDGVKSLLNERDSPKSLLVKATKMIEMVFEGGYE